MKLGEPAPLFIRPELVLDRAEEPVRVKAAPLI